MVPVGEDSIVSDKERNESQLLCPIHSGSLTRVIGCVGFGSLFKFGLGCLKGNCFLRVPGGCGSKSPGKWKHGLPKTCGLPLNHAQESLSEAKAW